MPIRYVSNSATNGFAVGSNSNTDVQAQNPLTPWLTLAYAVANATAGDEIILNDGTYQHSGSLTPAVANLIINPFTRRGVVLQSTSGTNSIIDVALAATGLDLGPVILDGIRLKNAAITCDTSNNVTLRIRGTKIMNTRTHGITSLARCTRLIMSDGWEIELAGDVGTTNNGISGVPTQSCVWDITDGTINLVGTATATSVASGIQFSPTAAMVGTIDGLTINMVGQAGAGDIRGIYAEGVSTLRITNNRITYSGSRAPTVYGIIVPNDAVDTSNAFVVQNRIEAEGFGDTTNIGIQLGNNSLPAVSNKVVTVGLYNNYVKNFNHGILMGYIAASRATRNEVFNAKAGIVAKVVTGVSSVDHNFVHGGTFDDGALRSRGSTNNLFTNNVVVVDEELTDANALPFYADESPEGGNTGTGVYNNIFICNRAVTRATRVDATNTVTFRNNLYYGANGWSYLGLLYSSIIGWQAIETGAIEADPQLVGGTKPMGVLDLLPKKTSPALQAGFSYATKGAGYSDFRGTLPRIPLDIGMFQRVFSDAA